MNKEQAWARELLNEYERINRGQKIGLTPALIAIGKARKELGNWQATNRTITISATLIEEHSWDTVCQILRHEMAHQYVEEIDKCVNVKPHGKEFQKACEKLAVSGAFRRATIKLADGEQYEPSPLERRVKKLFALASSSEIHEAEAAFTKAQKLITQYNLTPSHKEEIFFYKQIIIAKKQVPSWIKLLATIIQKEFFVQIIFISCYQARDDCHHRAVELLGRKENLAIAEHAFCFLLNQLPRLWLLEQKKSKRQGKERNSFLLGVLSGFQEKIEREHNFLNNQEKSLIAQGETALSLFLRERYPHIRRRKHQGPRLYQKSYSSGQEIGRKLTIHQGLQQTNREKKLLSD